MSDTFEKTLDTFRREVQEERKPIELYHWSERNEEGCVHITHARKIREVLYELNTALKAERLEPDEYGFDLDWQTRNDEGYDALWPRPCDYRFIACYAVEGGSEGHYIHIELTGTPGGKVRRISLGKTFLGMEHALKISNACTYLLGA